MRKAGQAPNGWEIELWKVLETDQAMIWDQTEKEVEQWWG